MFSQTAQSTNDIRVTHIGKSTADRRAGSQHHCRDQRIARPTSRCSGWSRRHKEERERSACPGSIPGKSGQGT